MSNSLYWFYTFLGLAMANSAFFIRSIRILIVVWLCLSAVFIGLGVLIESKIAVIQEKAVSFYIILFLLFAILSFPGFVLRFLKKR
jgi:Protein of unknown function (DUF2818)